MDTPTHNRLLDFLDANWNKVYNLPCVSSEVMEYEAPAKIVGGKALELLWKFTEKTVPQYVVALERQRNSFHIARKLYPLEYRREVVAAYNILIQEIVTLFPNPTIVMTDEDLHPLLREEPVHDGNLDSYDPDPSPIHQETVHADVQLEEDSMTWRSQKHILVRINGGYGDYDNCNVYLDPGQALSLLTWLNQNRTTLESLVSQEKKEG